MHKIMYRTWPSRRIIRMHIRHDLSLVAYAQGDSQQRVRRVLCVSAPSRASMDSPAECADVEEYDVKPCRLCTVLRRSEGEPPSVLDSDASRGRPCGVATRTGRGRATDQGT